MKLTANVRKVLVMQFLNGATIAELARTWPFAPPKIEAVMRERLRFHETNGAVFDAATKRRIRSLKVWETGSNLHRRQKAR